ncbi:hypothetical protein [Aquimarina sp. SS2-1]|uniref:hypothetical protein n=1 Tax=Aquimarina besae TaxID=3342247 RepID=UPI00366D4D56
MNINKLLENEFINHDELIESIFVEFKNANKEKYVALFLSSLHSNKTEYRSGLSVLAILQSFPKHKFELREGQKSSRISPCKICSNYQQIESDIELIEESFEDVGGLTGFQLLDYSFYLNKTNGLETATPTKEDYRIFSEILEILINADSEETVKKTVQKQISKIKGFKSNTEQRQALLETLGYYSILETDEHKGLLNQYINLATAPSKTHSSDWNYPVDFWLGKDGINKEALKFWFGEYPQLQKFWK